MQQQPNPGEPDTRLVTALLGTVVVGFIAVSYPALIPAITVAGVAFMALALVLKL
ncbi:hypothetical protein OG892_39690 [Streptomyces sp. NBC_00341]|uniref:hypothetical protein n=1 Tax=Streptomyces sp. NBC_00341 TaxID=2975717 RepID=UPI00309065FE|nr:hypothetical protein OG892_39690 [Streptomyces sp. NBC_00341]